MTDPQVSFVPADQLEHEPQQHWFRLQNLVPAPGKLPRNLPSGWRSRPSKSNPNKAVLYFDGLKLYATIQGNNYRLQWASVKLDDAGSTSQPAA